MFKAIFGSSKSSLDQKMHAVHQKTHDALRIKDEETQKHLRLLGDASYKIRRDAVNFLLSDKSSISAITWDLERVVALFQDSDHQVKEGAVRILSKLAPWRASEIGSTRGALEGLVASLQDPDAEVRQNAVGALWNLASHAADNRVKIGSMSGALEGLVALLQDTNSEVRGSAAGALRDLAANNADNQVKIGSIPGALERLAALLWHSHVRGEAADALKNLAAHPDNKVKIGSIPRALESLVALLQDPDRGLRDQAMDVLANLAVDNGANQVKIASMPGVLERLVALLQDPKEMICGGLCSTHSRKQAAGVLNALALNNAENQLKIGSMPKALESLVALLQDPDMDTETIESATGLLNSLSTQAKIAVQIERIKAGASDSTAMPKPPSGAPSLSSDPAVSSGSIASASTIDSSSISALSLTRYEDIQFGSMLGEGGFGVVYRGKWSHIDVAVKQLKVARLSEKALTEFRTEAELHGALRHANVVQLYAVCLEAAKYCMVMELMSNGSLFNVLHNGRELPWSLRLSIAKDIAVGLNYLHSRGILHRDLKSLNVLLDDRMRAKLSDFGLSTLKSESSSTTTAAKGKSAVGTVQWMAPELFKRGTKKSELSDIYALGMTLWELASREIPFKDGDGNEAVIIKWITDGEQEKIPEDTPKPFAALIARCWAQRAEDRPLTPAIIAELGAGLSGGASSTFSESSGYKVFSS